MKPIFIDFHIHTSMNPEKLNESYNIDILKTNIENVADGSEYLISLTDHNTINKSVYLNAIQKIKNLLLGVELHIRNYENEEPYHCHILFNLEKIDSFSIDKINSKLDELYPKKVVKGSDKNIPQLEVIMKCFDEFEFVILPHGGQNHSTFDKSIPNDVKFDDTLMRNIYYNHFDGFTARSNIKLDRTNEYFERLGIKEFVNLVTASDNYNPEEYPKCKGGNESSDFIPTWMLASPTFNGLRLSLSESSRLVYGKKPDSWAEFIRSVSLKNQYIDIDVKLTPGLNVVIGGSSSGKSLLVDSIYRKIINDFDNCIYTNTQYEVINIQVENPAGQFPHYFDQNYISKICDPKNLEYNIDDISILKNLFPSDKEESQVISNGLSQLDIQLSQLILSVKEIENLQNKLIRIPKFSHLIVTEKIKRNPLRDILPNEKILEKVEYGKSNYDNDILLINKIDDFLSNNPLINHDKNNIQKIKDELIQAYKISEIEKKIREIIFSTKRKIDEIQESENREIATKRQQFEDLLDVIRNYFHYEKIFNESLKNISMFKIDITTKEIESMGHKLFIDNEFELTKEKFLEVINSMLKQDLKEQFNEIKPELLFESNFRKRDPKVIGYEDFEKRIKSKFNGMNKKKYRIITKEGNDFDKLSAGWKTSVILDLLLGWGNDNAPLIIDQPEDNLATRYINHGLLEAIKKCKTKKQIILVSHNATIPMLGDAQNIILCKNENNKIKIRSNPLEGYIDGYEVVDLIAETTDGGKASVKKRVKKYNMKKFRGANEINIQKK